MQACKTANEIPTMSNPSPRMTLDRYHCQQVATFRLFLTRSLLQQNHSPIIYCDPQSRSMRWIKSLGRLLRFHKLGYSRQRPGPALPPFTHFPPERDAAAKGAQCQGPLHSGCLPGGKRPASGPPRAPAPGTRARTAGPPPRLLRGPRP